MAQISRFKLGLFVLGGLAVLLATMFFLGLSDLFKTRARITTLFSESVQGLAVGSPVKYKGVPIGNVSTIAIQVNDKLIRVDMEIELSAFIDSKPLQRRSTESLKSFYEFFDRERSSGLRARLEYAGITGLKYIEFDYFDPSNPQDIIKQTPDLAAGQFYLPSTPSTFTDLLGMFSTSLNRISQVDFVGISNELKRGLGEATALLSDPDLKVIVQRIESISNNLERSSGALARTLTEERLRTFSEQLETAVNNINTLINDVNEQLAQANVAGTASAFREAAGSVTQAGNDIRGVVGSADETMSTLEVSLQKLNRALDAVTELMSYLNDDPSAMLRGKRQPPMEFKRQ